MKAAGFDVQQEYYVNDAGNQMSKFFESVYARWLQLNHQDGLVPEDGYHGEYLIEVAKTITESIPHTNTSDTILKIVGTEGLNIILQIIKTELSSLGIEFDNWFSEKSLYDNGQYEKILDILNNTGNLIEKDGAKWFTSTNFDDSRDNVIVRSSGTATYFATDIAYHYNKFSERKFDLVIDIWGADHQGHIKRMKGAMQAIGINPDKLNIITTQMVSIKNQNQRMKLSTRKNQLVTLKQLLDIVGKDACRFFFISRSPESQMEFDMDLATKSSKDNPVYYIQYAHARTSNILRTANELSIDYSQYDLTLLNSEPEILLIKKILMLPELIDFMALYQQPHHLPHYTLELANKFHSFYEKCRVISNGEEEIDISKARLQLVKATKITLKKCLALMGMSAPDKM
jgi:arginyl-tRNA synthetase